MSFRRLEKSFDDPEARRPRVSIADLWSAEAWFFVGPPTDTHPEIARRFDREGLSPVLDIGCGTGALGRCLEGRWFGVDISIEQLREAEGPRALAEATRLPFPDSSFAGAAALYVLYFFEDPAVVVAEARRVLRPGGLFAGAHRAGTTRPSSRTSRPARRSSSWPRTFPASSRSSTTTSS